MDTHSITSHPSKLPLTDGPSSQIDQAVLSLLTRIGSFSDQHFDTAFVALDESELEQMVVLLLQHVTENLDGRLLAGYLLAIREEAIPINQAPLTEDSDDS